MEGRACGACGACGGGAGPAAPGDARLLRLAVDVLHLERQQEQQQEQGQERGLCSRCRGLLRRLRRAEERWLGARASFRRALQEAPGPAPPPPPAAPDSDDEPLFKWKAPCDTDKPFADDSFIDDNDVDDEPVIDNVETIRREYSCRECLSVFESEEQATLHVFTIHRIDRLTDPDAIVESPINNKKKKHSRKHKRKSLSDNDDDDDWTLSLKKNKSKRYSSDVDGGDIDTVAIKTASQLQKKLGSTSLTIKKVPYSNNISKNSFSAVKRDQLTVIGKSNADIISQLQTAGLEINSQDFVHKKKEKKPKKMLSCPECPSTFNSQARLDFHMVKHAGSKPPYICEICGASYKHKKACDIHVGMHKGISPWKCNECGKIFPSKGALSRHEAIHTGTPNYQCDLCGKSFIHTSSFKMHKLSHSGLKPHTCTKCGLSLMTRSHLKRHQRVHSGEKRHECECCGKKFSERYNLYAHQRGHYGTEFEGKSKSHDCSVCEATFTRRHLLDKHMEVVHHRVIDTPAKRPRNTMSKHLKQQISEPQIEILEVKLSLSPTPQPQLKIEIPVIGTTVLSHDELMQRDIKPDIRVTELEECHNLEPPLDGQQQPWDRIPSLANDYPLRMHGVDYAGYLNRQ